MLLEACGQMGCVVTAEDVLVIAGAETPNTGGSAGRESWVEQPSPASDPYGLLAGLSSLPECGPSTMLSVPPLDPSAYQVIIPLGLLSTPQHVLPTSHIYYHLNRTFPDSGGDREANPPAVADVRAPGDIRVLGINYTVARKDGQLWYKDYDVFFSPCRDRLFESIHMSALNPELTGLLEAAEPYRCDEYGSVETRYEYCKTTAQLDINAGTLLGTTGGNVSAALDLEAYDLSTPALAFANPDRYFSDLDLRLHVTCPLDWFTDDARDEQAARIGGYDGQPRTSSPVCGQVMQDVPGTAQGNWFAGPPGSQTDWAKEMALVHDHVDPTLAAISIGGTVMEMGVWLFPPEDQGLINREFAQVRPGGQIYCYQGGVSSEFGQRYPEFPGRLLIRMETPATLTAERQDGPCRGGMAFIDPVAYQR